MAKKLYYKIGEACKILEIQPYVLRYWETEFPLLSPNKSKSGQRVYGDSEIEVIGRIKELLYEEGYTIAGAKKKLDGELAAAADGGTSALPRKQPKKAKGRKRGAAGEKTGGDRGEQKRVEELRLGVEGALRQARAILEVLQSDPSA